MDNPQTLPQAEEWRPVVGYEGWYEVSDIGRIRRVKRGRRTYYGRILKPVRNRCGYLQVMLSCDGRDINKRVHALVALAFLGPRHGLCVNHIDGNKLNNAIGNLEYVTYAENAQHAHRMGLCKPTMGEKNPNAKLTKVQVDTIRRKYPATSIKQLAAMFSVSNQNVSLIVKGKTWLRS